MRPTDRHPCRRALAAVALLGLLALGWSGTTVADPQAGDQRARVEGAFLVNFIRFTEWPRAGVRDDRDAWVVVVVGSTSVADAIREVATAAGPVQGRRITVRQVAGDRLRRQRELVRGSHLVFVDRSAGVSAEDVVELLRGTHVLTVGDSAGFVRAGGMLGLVASGPRVGFVANPAAIRNGGLAVSAKVLKLAQDPPR